MHCRKRRQSLMGADDTDEEYEGDNTDDNQ